MPEGVKSEKHEIIDSGELAKRWTVPTTWIRSPVRKAVADPIRMSSSAGM
jgi:hypothetical protein